MKVWAIYEDGILQATAFSRTAEEKPEAYEFICGYDSRKKYEVKLVGDA